MVASNSSGYEDAEITILGKMGGWLWVFCFLTGLVGMFNIAILVYFFSITCGTNIINAYTYTQVFASIALFGMTYVAQKHRDDGQKIAPFCIFWLGILVNLGIAIWGLIVVFANSYGRTTCFVNYERGLLSYLPISALCLGVFYGMMYVYAHFKYVNEDEEKPVEKPMGPVSTTVSASRGRQQVRAPSASRSAGYV